MSEQTADIAATHQAMVSAKGSKVEQMVILSQFLQRSRFGQLAGIQYGGLRDIYAVAGYPKQNQLKFDHYWSLYKRGDIAGRIVDMPANTTWRTPPEVTDDAEHAAESEFEKAWKTLAKRLKVWSYFQRVDRLAGIGQYAVLMIGVKGVDDVGLKTPLMKADVNSLIYLSVYHEGNATIAEYETNTGNERYGLPALYKLRTTNDQGIIKTAMPELAVHASRVLHVAEDVLEDDVFGRPRLERSLNRLMDLDKVAASTGEAYWQLATQILQAKVDKDAVLSDAELDKLDEALQEMVHDLRRQFTGKGVDLQWLGTTPPDPSQVSDFYFSLIAGSAEIPKRILFGSELGQLASTTDQETYFGRINERQEHFAEPNILRAFIDRMIALGALPKPKDSDYQIFWPELFEEDAPAKAATNLKSAQAAMALTPMGGNPRELVKVDDEGMIEFVEREPDEPLPLDQMFPPPGTDQQGTVPDGGAVTGKDGATKKDDTSTKDSAGKNPSGAQPAAGGEPAKPAGGK